MNVSDKDAQEIALDFVKKKKSTERVDVSSIEQKGGTWIFKGTCPINLEGHPWAEKFEVVVDQKGKIVFTEFALL